MNGAVQHRRRNNRGAPTYFSNQVWPSSKSLNSIISSKFERFVSTDQLLASYYSPFAEMLGLKFLEHRLVRSNLFR